MVLDLPHRPLDYTLSTEVSLPPELRGRPLTLTTGKLEALASLRAGGEEAIPLESDVIAVYRVRGWQAWRIAPSSGPTLKLELTVEHRSLFSARLITVPRLSATPRGDRRYLVVSRLNETTLITGLAFSLLISFMYLISYLSDRRRTLHAWMLVQALGSCLVDLNYLGYSQALFGVWDSGPAILGSQLGILGAMHFVHGHFELGRVPRWVWWLFLPVACGELALSGPFLGPGAGAVLASLFSLPAGFYLIAITARQLRGPRPGDARLVLATLVALFLLTVPDSLMVSGHPPFGLALETLPLGHALSMLAQAALLTRERTRFLRDLEARSVEVEQLNVELRRQIADRAGQLASAISRLSLKPRNLQTDDLIEERYRVVRPLGQGGMGAVYEVERLADGKRLALKVLRGVADRELLARFAREAQIAAQLGHPNVVSVLDVDVSKSGMLFLVMELVSGATLAAEKSRWGDPRWAVPILKQVAAALAVMHARGIVHRDLKPANVLLDGDTPKVADFGIASLAETHSDDSTLTAGLTGPGAFMGTPQYMAPELLHGVRNAQPSADIWSFGVLAHELLANRPPFSEAPMLARLAGRSAQIDVTIADQRLRALVEPCLHADPASRPTAQSLALQI